MTSRDKTRVYGGVGTVRVGLERLWLLSARANIDSTQDTKHLYQTADFLKSTPMRLKNGGSGCDCEQEDLV